MGLELFRGLALGVVAAWALGCHAPPPRSPPPARSAPPPAAVTDEPSALTGAHLAELAAFVADVRGHPFTKPLPRIRFAPTSELPRGRYAAAGADWGDGLGTYDPTAHEIVLREELARSPDRDRVLVHELAHALVVDVRGAGALVVTGGAGEDLEAAAFAQSALLEGDASLVEAAFVGSRAGASARRIMAGATRVHSPWYSLPCRRDPAAAACSMSQAIFDEGRAFVSALYRAGGIALVDQAHAAPPRSALEILFPDLYLAGVAEVSLVDAARAAAAAAKVPSSSVNHFGAYRLGQLFSTEVPVEALRRLLHELRGDAAVEVGGGFVVVTEWADEKAQLLAAVTLGRSPNVSWVPVGKQRLVLGAGVARDVAASVAKRLSAKPAAPPVVARGAALAIPPTWEEELAADLAAGGPPAFRRVGLDLGAGAQRAPTPGANDAWTFGDGAKVFFLPATASALTQPLLQELVGKAWPDLLDALGPPEGTEEVALAIGRTQLSVARLTARSSVYVAVARIPLCGDGAAALFALEFGTGPDAKARLAADLARVKPTPEPALCDRIRDR